MEKKLVDTAREAERAINENPEDEKRVRYYSGAVAVEILREGLRKAGFNVSARDVFVKGFDKEIDMLVLKKGARPKYNLLYDAGEVLAAFEVKARGIFAKTGGKELNRVKAVREILNTLRGLNDLNKEIYCFYVTTSESRNWETAYEKFPEDVYCLSWGNGRNAWYADGCWERLLKSLREIEAGFGNL